MLFITRMPFVHRSVFKTIQCGLSALRNLLGGGVSLIDAAEVGCGGYFLYLHAVLLLSL